jgi:hypothetical protein
MSAAPDDRTKDCYESLTLRELEVMDHATAWSRKPKRSRLSRNHFCASEGHDACESIAALVERGLMQRGPVVEPTGYPPVYSVTKAGIEALKRWRP